MNPHFFTAPLQVSICIKLLALYRERVENARGKTQNLPALYFIAPARKKEIP